MLRSPFFPKNNLELGPVGAEFPLLNGAAGWVGWLIDWDFICGVCGFSLSLSLSV